MFAADRSITCSLGEADDSAAKFDEPVGVVIDVFHLWFDVEIYRQIERAGKRILGFHVSDKKLRAAIEKAGYKDFIEVKIFNRKIWDADAKEVLKLIKDRFSSCV